MSNSLNIRKIVKYEEEILTEGGKAAETSTKLCSVAVVLRSPWRTDEYVENLSPVIEEIAPKLGDIMVPRLLKMCGSGEAVQSFGKAVVVGADVDIEHGSGLIHTLDFGNKFRNAVGGTSFLSYTNVRGGLGYPISVPLVDKNDSSSRDHYMTVQFAVQDAPRADEIVIVIAAAMGPRLNARIGNRHLDAARLSQ